MALASHIHGIEDYLLTIAVYNRTMGNRKLLTFKTYENEISFRQYNFVATIIIRHVEIALRGTDNCSPLALVVFNAKMFFAFVYHSRCYEAFNLNVKTTCEIP